MKNIKDINIMKKKYTIETVVELLLFIVSLLLLILLYIIFDEFYFGIIVIMVFSLGLGWSNISKLRMIDAINKNNNELIQLYNDFFVMTNNYFITNSFILKKWNYNDIALVFVIKDFDVHPFYLHIYNKNGSTVKIHITYDNDYEICDKVIKLLLEKNPNILVGNNEENRKLMLEKYNIKVKNNEWEQIKWKW